MIPESSRCFGMVEKKKAYTDEVKSRDLKAK